jgi:hypothetical protein
LIVAVAGEIHFAQFDLVEAVNGRIDFHRDPQRFVERIGQ